MQKSLRPNWMSNGKRSSCVAVRKGIFDKEKSIMSHDILWERKKSILSCKLRDILATPLAASLPDCKTTRAAQSCTMNPTQCCTMCRSAWCCWPWKPPDLQTIKPNILKYFEIFETNSGNSDLKLEKNIFYVYNMPRQELKDCINLRWSASSVASALTFWPWRNLSK